MVKEVVSVHMGQAGVQLGTALWELFCLEHGLTPTGTVYQSDRDDLDGVRSFFTEDDNCAFSPRAVLMDLEPTVIDMVKQSVYKELYQPSLMISGKEDAANNFARGHYTVGKDMWHEAMDMVRVVTESCEHLQGFMLYHSAGGGTGSGFQSLVVEYLSEEYPKRTILDFAIYPSPKMATSVVEPYNVVLSTNATLEHTTCEFLADNEALYDICNNMLEVDRPTYKNLNRLIAQAVSSITASQRFEGVLSADFFDFQTNLVPFPRIHFPLIAYAPLVSASKVAHENLSIADVTKSTFDPHHSFVKCEYKKTNRYMACCLLYRGDIAPKDVNKVICSLKEKKVIKFVDWSPTGIKVGINYQPPSYVPGGDLAGVHRALCMLANTTAIVDAWARLNYKYKLMADKRAFFHWYASEGMDIDEFYEAQENIQALESDYKEVDSELPQSDYEY